MTLYATPDDHPDSWRCRYTPTSAATDRLSASSIGSISGLGGSQSPIGVFDRRGLFTIDSPECGWYQNTSGSTQTIRAQNAFGFGGYTMGCWVVVSATAPSAMNPTPAADATAAGATQLAIASGAGNSGASTVSVPNGSYVYIVQIDVDITWAGSSHQFVVLATTGGTILKLVGFFVSPGSGHPIDSWKSDAFITGGTKYPPNGVYGEGATATTVWGHYQHFLVPNNYYVYLIAASFDITWAGASDMSILMWDEANGVRGADYLCGWPSPNNGSHHLGEWDSAAFITGGVSVRPNADWVNDGGTLNGGTRTILNPSPSPIGAGTGHGNGWYQNTTGGDLKLRSKSNFIAAGYSDTAWLLVTAADPTTAGSGGAAVTARSQSIVIA